MKRLGYRLLAALVRKAGAKNERYDLRLRALGSPLPRRRCTRSPFRNPQ